MNKANTVYESESDEQVGLKLKLAYMVEDFVELFKKEETERLVTEEN